MTDVKIPGSFVDFATLEKVTEGGHRTIFTCADYPQIVFKLQKPRDVRLGNLTGLRGFLLKYWAPFENYNLTLENRTYLDFFMKRDAAQAELPVARIYGFVNSDT